MRKNAAMCDMSFGSGIFDQLTIKGRSAMSKNFNCEFRQRWVVGGAFD